MNDDLTAVPTKRVGKERQHRTQSTSVKWATVESWSWCDAFESMLVWHFDLPGKPGTLISEFLLNQILQNSFWQCHSLDNWVGSEIGVKLLEWPNGAVLVQRDCPNHPLHNEQTPETLQGRSRYWCKVYIVIHWDSTLHWITYSGMSVENIMIHPLHPAGSPPCITVW